ncbi:penicillin-binding protein activator LpoB [Photorhabdus laumondii subsp. laumondii]|uniref:Penicillin-binding protein activator LpoB n=3 Tax=Photorhabdus TaxID=29487 RepID=LPOB_PHOLL|nr:MULTISPECIES: penicillin-binding protein activator LpoB [Photorhabdus]Q7N395.1 RecName: Full=Penicillin-binding protein activator LpoB; Short=PBP activator LpoB; Flags: Precursor [Photorhabdus laumondii subsp. laumondii TTO1]AWK44550.1 penicillin-binding protein activator LpoB [Photorhabdus laumondii subsp. laumondii]AXG43392.1 penicillin-binding protein activator LpoB [Photorhabdus laumondii subsp. laumondii]AXG47863.1 penicillin-binding protein activator LpoB [Photorhabdus laumondii subsp.
MRRILFVALSVMFLAGCPSLPPEQPEPPTPVVPVTPSEKPTPPSEKVPEPPKMSAIDWESTVQPLVEQLVKAHGLENAKLLLVDTVKNNTNGALQTMQATDALRQAISSEHVFELIPQNQVQNARQSLGLSEEDSLGLRSKAIGLARYLNAEYVLYSIVSGNSDKRDIVMQLMLVKTGEILWSGHGDVK